MATRKTVKTARGWAVITPRGKIRVDTVSVDRESAETLRECVFGMGETGTKIVPVIVSYSVRARR